VSGVFLPVAACGGGVVGRLGWTVRGGKMAGGCGVGFVGWGCARSVPHVGDAQLGAVLYRREVGGDCGWCLPVACVRWLQAIPLGVAWCAGYQSRDDRLVLTLSPLPFPLDELHDRCAARRLS
jgi:hypothetical protein